MKYKFVPDAGIQADWRFEGLTWEVVRYDDGEFYMDGGQFSIPINVEDIRSLSFRANRQGIFVEIKE